ncbi:H/ACA ribonucleoprotein complex subunit GAR1 [Archaeoglobus veneficus]|uniref:H/ACA RNA-protein complex protein Gar1 n=1 Tax=Archaeoglobus veneficus (strain DSM 11195 / SNP6) TaxID=693661 RepID=F2KRD4_ARCVS|nr:hypothetical protein [Archaeoglobus veneficus]AEA47868.1 hypothetical protein Arcve_1875 [Archaeoglobus veneficus SNP6]
MMLRKLGRGYPSRTGNIIVAADPKNLPGVGMEVVTRKMEKVGFVYDIIGPVKSPFIVVRPKNRDLIKKIIIDELFVVSAHAGSRKGKGNRKEGKRKRSRKKGNRKGRHS